MQTAQWEHLCTSMYHEMPFIPQFRIKYHEQDSSPVHDANELYWGYSWWDELGRVGQPYDSIEYLLVRGYQLKGLHKYAKPEIIDGTAQLEKILKKLGFRYEEDSMVFRVFGDSQ